MKKATTRRLFLRTAGITAVGLTAIPSAFAVNNFSNTEKLTDQNFYDASLNINRVQAQLLIHGVIIDKLSKQPIKNAHLEVWHQSDESGELAARYKVISDENGRYRFTTKRPGKLKGRSPRVNFKLSKPNTSYTTELIVTDFGAHITDKHWLLNQEIGEQLFPQQTNHQSHTEFTFNLSI